MQPVTDGPDVQQGMSTRRALLLGGGLAAGAGLIVNAPVVLGVAVLPPCPFLTLTGFDCPFCGGTRATHALLTGDIATAFDYNILVPFLALTAVLAGGWWLLSRATPRVSFEGARSVAGSRTTWIVVAVALVMFWIARNLPAFAFLSSSG